MSRSLKLQLYAVLLTVNWPFEKATTATDTANINKDDMTRVFGRSALAMPYPRAVVVVSLMRQRTLRLAIESASMTVRRKPFQNGDNNICNTGFEFVACDVSQFSQIHGG